MKATAVAPSNIALIKYWGKKDERLRLPLNGSVSVNLSGLITKTTVEFLENYQKDEVIINGIKDSQKAERVLNHLDRIRKIANIKTKAKVVSENNFPTASGLASSASGFAALTLAASYAAGVNLSEKELSILARQGSGSACRSIPDGFVEWYEGSSNETSYAQTIFPADYWDILIISVVVNQEEKPVLSTKGMGLANENPFMKVRLEKINEKINFIKKYIERRKFTEFGELVEKEALELHAMTLTSKIPIIYWEPTTIKIMKLVQKWRSEGLESYFTIDAGPHLKILCQDKDKEKITANLKAVGGIYKIITNKPADGSRLSNKHLF